MSKSSPQAEGILFIRALLGVIFLMQGWGKVFQYGIWGVYENAFKVYESMLPKPLLVSMLVFSTFAELLGGVFLVIGLYREWTYRALAAVLVLVSFGHGLASPIWDLQHVFFRAVLLTTLFLLPIEWDVYSIDQRLKK